MRATRHFLAAAALMSIGLGSAWAQDVQGASETVRRAIHVCAACHGQTGHSTTKGVPSLAGQQRQYTIAQLKDFRAQNRAEAGNLAYMWGVSALLDDATIEGLADYYAGLPPTPGKPGPAPLMRQGRKLYVEGAPKRGIRACASCHGDKGEGAAGFPRIAGQRTDYVEAQLKTFSTRLRPHGVLMKDELKAVTPAEMKALAVYVHSL